MKPIIKYRGGKSREIEKFSQYIPKEFDRYFEPFFGGGAVYFDLEPHRAVINDVNSKLITFYRQLKEQYPTMRRQLDALQALYDANETDYLARKARHPNDHVLNRNEALYYHMRDLFNHPTDEYLEGVVYFFINKTAYSGMIRYNAQGEYNVPFGRYKNFNTNLITQEHSDLLQNTEILNGDYSAAFQMAHPDDFMFLDPPYDCVFNDYGNIQMENGFDHKEHVRLAEAFHHLNCRALMIVGETELTRDLYRNEIIGSYNKSYAVNIRNRFKSEATHLIVANYHL